MSRRRSAAPPPTDPERMQAFRRAAGRVRETTVIDRGEGVHLRIRIDVAARTLGVDLDGPDDERFIAFATALRICYLNDEPANFLAVFKSLERARAPLGPDDDILARAREVRRQFQDALVSTARFVLYYQPISGKEIFEVWLHGKIFHNDLTKLARWDELCRAFPESALQHEAEGVALQLAGRVLDLDDVLADHLGEERMPRIGAEE